MTDPPTLSSSSSSSSNHSNSNSNNHSSSNNDDSDSDACCVQVAVRVRPLLPLEGDDESCVTVFSGRRSIQIGGSRGPRFTFDHVFDTASAQPELYARRVAPLVVSCLEGYNATVLLYGQTGSGKTHTAMGRLPPSSGGVGNSNNSHHAAAASSSSSSSSSSSNPAQLFRVDEDAGVIPRAFADIFQSLRAKKEHLQRTGYGELEFQVSIQFLELYGEEIRDLLTSHRGHDQQKLTVRDLGQAEPEVVGATQQPVAAPQEALQCLAHGMLRRVTGATAMNESSSRSHAILSVCVEQSVVLYSGNSENNSDGSSSSNNNENSNDPSDDAEQDVQVTRSKFSCVDLAGAERVKRTGATGTRLQEGIDINKGLLALGSVVSCLGDPTKRGKHTHVPYRDSKLTRLLKGSLGGNHKTLMIACVSPAACNMGESLNCLRYANRAKNIQNKAVLNVDANTKRVQELQTQVQALATDLLKAMDKNGEDNVTSQFTREALATLAEGNTAANIGGGSGLTPMKPQPTSAGKLLLSQQRQQPMTPAPPAQQQQQQQQSANKNASAADRQKLQQVREELCQTQEQLRQSQAHHDAAELELQTVRAQNTWCDVQIAALTSEENGGQGGSGNVISKVEEVFRERALEYEEEIGSLRRALRRATARMGQAISVAVGNDDHSENDDDDDEARILAEEEQRLGQAKERWMELRAELSLGEHAPHTGNDADNGGDALNDTFDLNEQKEQAALDHLTQKYLVDVDNDDDDEVLANNLDGEVDPESKHPPEAASTLSQSSNNVTREPQLTQAELDELSHNIATKERLIKQIKRNKEREAKMREFYEGKLQEMEVTLAERESEREQLLKDLENATGRTTRSSERLKAKLQEKEEQIAALKRMQENFRKQTLAAKQKAADKGNLQQLQNDVKLMKRRKADLQKELASEKRSHAKDVNNLNKIVMQKDREISKIQRASNRHAMEAEKAKQVSKSRLEELAALKKTLKNYKRSAGLDPVLVGRRQSRPNPRNKGSATANDNARSAAVDADLLRDFFDAKVAHVVRKEALVDKLAKEWEEYFELNTQLNELASEPETEEIADALQTLEVQLQFQNDKIRKLAKRLGTKDLSHASDDAALSKEDDSFLFDKEFSKLCSGHGPEISRSTAAKVLFGMIVRERRRVAALAKTASTLDERLHAAEKNVEASEATLRSYIDEHRQEVVELTQAHQDHIISLMDMVKVESDGATGPSEEEFQKKLLVLANERVALLEDELTELRVEKVEMEEFTAKLEELKGLLEAKTEECEHLEETRNILRTVLRQLRDEAAKHRRDESDDLGCAVVRLVDEYLHPSSSMRLSPNSRRKNGRSPMNTPRGSLRSPRLQKHIELMHSSDSDSALEDEEETETTPEWSLNMMADLALIAEGKIPESLNSPKILDEALQLEGNLDAAGIGAAQKKKALNSIRESPTDSQHVAECSDAVNHPTSSATREHEGQQSENDPHVYQSVFERLGSPSQFTGTQKERFQEHEAKRQHSAEEVASRVLHHILDDKDDETEAPENNSAEKPNTSSFRSEYVKQNVFDRLQKTTTLAAAVRQNETLHHDSRPGGDNSTRNPPGSAGTSDATTHTAKNEPKSTVISHARGNDVGKKSSSEKPRQNVFERLSKTTTEAYAKKTNRSSHDKNDS